MKTSQKYSLLVFIFTMQFIFFPIAFSVFAQSWTDVNDSYVESYKNGDFKKSLELARKALGIAKVKYGVDHANYATSQYYLGRTYRELGNYKLAEPLFVNALKLRLRKFGRLNANYITVYNSLGLLYKDLGWLTESELILKEVVALNRQTLGDKHLHTAISVDNLGGVLLALGDYEQAEVHFALALRMKESTVGVNDPQYAASLNNMGMYCQERAMYNRSLSYFEEALSIYENSYGKDDLRCATVINNIGLFYLQTGNYPAAGLNFISALKIKDRQLGKNHPSYAKTLNNLAGAFEKEGSTEMADSLYHTALIIKRESIGTFHPDYATALDNMAAFYISLKKYSDAEIYADSGLIIREKVFGKENADYATSLNHKAIIHHRLGLLELARNEYEEVLRIRKLAIGDNHLSYAASLSNLAAIYISLKNYVKAEEIFKLANNLFIEQIQIIFPSLSETEKDLYLSTIDFNFEIFSSFAISRSKVNPQIINDLYNLQLQTKALISSSAAKLRTTIMTGKDEKLKREVKRLMSIKERIAKAYVMGEKLAYIKKNELDEMILQANAIEKSISKNAPIFSDISKNVDWKCVKDKLEYGEAAIEILRFRDFDNDWTDRIRYAAIIIVPNENNILVANLENGNELDDRYRKIYVSMIQRKQLSRDFGPTSAQSTNNINASLLYNNYWKDIASLIGSCHKVYFSPNGVYHLINLKILSNSITEKFVLDEVDIDIVESTRDICVTYIPTEAYKNKVAILVGNPAFDLSATDGSINNNDRNLANAKGSDVKVLSDIKPDDQAKFRIPRLPGTLAEVENITQLLSSDGWNCSEYMDKDANESKVKSVASPTLMHFATHGYYLNSIPEQQNNLPKIVFASNSLLYTGLLLAGSQQTINNYKDSSATVQDGDDGFLTAYEAENLDLSNTELVVLSACQTGLGDLIRDGEGAYSLHRAFKTAGAKAVLYSMWKIDDDATTKFMKYFYQKWLQTNDKRLALGYAQASMRKIYPDPYFWGAFNLLGN